MTDKKVKTESILNWLRDYANRRLNSNLIDARRCIPPYIVLDFGNKGVLGLQASVDYGGLALSSEDTSKVLEQLAAIDISLATFVVVHNFLGLRPIMKYGNDSIHQELLHQLASGRELGAFALTEPYAGSNPGAMKSRAVSMANGHIRLNGTKMWIGNASWANFINIFLRYIDESGVMRGTCCYIVRQDTHGFIMGPEMMTMGMRGMVQNTFTMENLEVDSSAQLSTVGKGTEIANDAIMHTRLALGAIFLGGMKRCLQLMVRYADRRTTISTGRLLDSSISLIHTSKLIVKIQIIENLLLFVNRRLDQSLDIPQDFFIVAKVSGSEFLWEATDMTMQILGGRGYCENNVVAQMLRDSRVGRIFEGPTEAMLHYLGTRLMLDSTQLVNFLENSLQSKDIAERLLETCAAVKLRCLGSETPFLGRQRLDFANFLLGNIVSWGLLFAVTRNTQANGALIDDRITHWVSTAFDNAISESLQRSADEEISYSSSEIIHVIDRYTSQIGNIEQQLSGEEWSMDTYIKK